MGRMKINGLCTVHNN